MRVCIIPAKGTSRRIPRKNIKLFHGKPIIAYSIETALESDLFSIVAVSTEDEEVADISRQYGAQVVNRPRNLAELDGAPDCGTQEVVRDALMRLGTWEDEDEACCLYATAPMLSPRTLVQASEWLDRHRLDYVIPMAEWCKDPGQFYYSWAITFIRQESLVGPGTKIVPIDPATAIDINTPSDWKRAEEMYLLWQKKQQESGGLAKQVMPTQTETK